MHLALVLHELATNARKYGALSVPAGRLSITWEVRTNGACSLYLAWKESDGPKVSAPHGHGFGRALIEQTVRSHGGEVSVHYHRDGLICEIDFPLPAHARANTGADIAAPKGLARSSLLAVADQRRTLDGKRILVIEDEPLVSMEMESNLANAGCEIVGPAATLDRAKILVETADYDAALVDVPCSNTGVLGRRPEVRWRLQPREFEHLIQLQTRLLRSAIDRVKPGGVIVYSTCSIEPDENSRLVRGVCHLNPAIRFEDEHIAIPDRPSDGGYWARLRKT